MSAYDAIVVGAGSAGVSTAALLQRRGYETLLVERQDDVGGRSSTFEYRGYQVDTGSHQLASYSSSGMRALVEDVGAEVDLAPVDPSLVHYDMTEGNLVEATKKERFPDEQTYEDFKAFVGTTVDMDRSDIAELHGMTALEWLDDNIENDDLKDFFKRITGFGGTPLENVSAGAFFETLHDSFMSDQTIQYPREGGIRHFPNAILEAFRRHGGDVAFGVGIDQITVEDGRVTGIRGRKRRPGLNMTVDVDADRVVCTIPLSMLFTIFPRDATSDGFVDKVQRIKKESIIYGAVFAGVEHELLERTFGGSDNQYFQVTVEPSPSLRPKIEKDWHALLTVPTYINPDQAPEGYDLVYNEIHVPISKGEPETVNHYQDVALDVYRELWPDFDEKVDWYHRVVEPNVLVLPPKQGLTGEFRPGFSVPGVEGMYLAGDAAYSSGSGIGSAVKSAWGAVRRVLIDDGREYDGPIEPYLATEPAAGADSAGSD